MLDGWSTRDGDYGGVYGLARDGHVIFGPYNSDGEVWTCDDVDMCNGFFLDDGSYGYASTTFFPYMVGCWGPAYASHSTMPSCTSSGCGIKGSTSGAGISTTSFSMVVLAFAALNSAL